MKEGPSRSISILTEENVRHMLVQYVAKERVEGPIRSSFMNNNIPPS